MFFYGVIISSFITNIYVYIKKGFLNLGEIILFLFLLVNGILGLGILSPFNIIDRKINYHNMFVLSILVISVVFLVVQVIAKRKFADSLKDLLEKGHINYGGVYNTIQDFKGLSFFVTGFFLVASQTFLEELIFRGLLLLYFQNYLTLMLFVQAFLFSLIHLIPLFIAERKQGIKIALGVKYYIFFMPFFISLILGSGVIYFKTLWFSWGIHFILNFFSLTETYYNNG